MIDYIHIFICIITSVIYIIISLIIGQNANQTLLRLIYVIVISYIAGLILKTYLKKKVFDQNDEAGEDKTDNSIGDGLDKGFDEDEDDF